MRKQTHLQSIYLLVCVFLILITGCASVPKTAVEEEIEAPEDKYHYYSGKEHAGNFYCKQQNFIHPDTHKEVALIGMIHIADADFYKKIQSICDASDLVLSEGIGGRGNLNFSSLSFTYAMAVRDRFSGAMRIFQQGEVLNESGENWQNADMTQAELSTHSSIPKDLLAGITLPLAALIIEPYNLIIHTEHTLAIATGRQDQKAAGIRHSFFSLMNLHEDTDSDKEPKESSYEVIPGVIDGRNDNLMAVFDENITNENCSSIVIPWGAAHNPGLEKQLIERGYQKTDTAWLRAVAVNDLLEGQVEAAGSRKIYIPYVLSVYRYNEKRRWSAAFNLLSSRRSERGKAFSLGYGHLYRSSRTTDSRSIALLPQFFGRPLLFDYRYDAEKETEDEKNRWRFLLFFSI